ncbi:MAG: class I SAM-dependent methyltransferase [Candidatus Pacebacteria bacterium]|nr:class I SAM-dependent methyltransferase [Candidatus Paceibacterota bacterium]
MPNIKPVICGVCGKSANLNFKEDFKEYSLWECPECFGQFWSPMKGPGAGWYEKDERYSFRNLNPLEKPERNHREFLRDLPAKGGRLLDIGMGTGNFLAAAVKSGYDGYGVDFDSEAIETAKRVFGLKNVSTGDLDGVLKDFGEKSFDIVTMFEVVEHLENPAEFIEKSKRLLKNGGYLAISVPFRGAAEFLKPNDKPPRHLTRWDKNSMENFLKEHEFETARIKIIKAPISYLITKFHFWTRGFLSFNAVGKLSAVPAGQKAVNNKVSLRARVIQKMARIKDYILFLLPAIILSGILLVTGRNGLGLYILAKKK